MSTKTITKENVTETDLHNLEVLKKLFSMTNCTKGHARLVNDLFYWHVEESIHSKEEMYLNSNDPFFINQVVHALQDFKYERKA